MQERSPPSPWRGSFLRLYAFDFFQTLRTDVLSAKNYNVFRAVTEDAAGTVLLQHDRCAVHINLQCFSLRNVQGTTQLNGQHDAPQLIHLPYDSGRFHELPSPLFLFLRQYGCFYYAIFFSSCQLKYDILLDFSSNYDIDFVHILQRGDQK